MRVALSTYYDYRLSSLQAHLDSLQKQREATIKKLKAATKYDTTQQLLEKYGGAPSKPKAGAGTNRKTSSEVKAPKGRNEGHTSFAPPPTANIPVRSSADSLPNTPQRPFQATPGQDPPYTASAATGPWPQPGSPLAASAEFAPNAFSSSQNYIQPGEGAKWYDRFLDILLGEDESSPKNRLALICQSCRLVNGLASPGAKSIDDVGKWRCSSCGSMNGTENEAMRIVEEIHEKAKSEINSIEPEHTSKSSSLEPTADGGVPFASGEDSESDVTQYSEDGRPPAQSVGDAPVDENLSAAKQKRRKGRSKKT